MKAAAHFIRIASGAVISAVLAIGLGGYVHAAKGADISPAAETPQTGALSADVRALLAPLAAKRVEGTFEERRSVPGFPKPMLSRGHFTLEGESLVWQTQTPFASLMKVTPEGVFLEAAGEKQALTAAEIPAVGRICTLLT
ncbi:LolA family protein, partial [Sutterella wadsworthensis]